MFEPVRQLMLLCVPLFAASGCGWLEPLYVGELKTQGVWTGTASVITLYPAEKDSEPVKVTALHIESGPDWTDPAHSNRESVVGMQMVLVDERQKVLSPGKWREGSPLRVKGLMRTNAAFDERGRRLYGTPERKFQLPTLRIERVEPLHRIAQSTSIYPAAPRGAHPTAIIMLSLELPTAGPPPAPASRPSMQLWVKAVSDQQIDTWWEAVDGAVAYRIDFSTDGEDFFDSKTLDAIENRCSNTDLFPDSMCFFKVTALGPNQAVLAVSDVASARTLPDPLADEPQLRPAHPEVEMRIWTKPVSSHRIDIWWDSIVGAKSYHVERSHDGKDFVAIQTIDAPEARASCIDLASKDRYIFRVTALGANKQVLKISNMASAITKPEK